jgi:hypothetical protein
MAKTKQTTRLSTGGKCARINLASDAARRFTMNLPDKEEEGLKLIINYQDCQKELENIYYRNEFPKNKNSESWSMDTIFKPMKINKTFGMERPKSKLFINEEKTKIAKIIKIKKQKDLQNVIKELKVYHQLPKDSFIHVNAYFAHYNSRYAILYIMKKFDTELCKVDHFRQKEFTTRPSTESIESSHKFIAKKVFYLLKSLALVCYENKNICFDLRCANMLLKLKDKRNGSYSATPKVRLIDLDYCDNEMIFENEEQACKLLYVIFYFNTMVHFTRKSLDVVFPRWLLHFQEKLKTKYVRNEIDWLKNNKNYMNFFRKLGMKHPTKGTPEKDEILFNKIKHYLVGEEEIDIIN